MIPTDAQEVFTAVVTARAVPWRPTDNPEHAELSWSQLVRENIVPATNAGMIDALERFLNFGADPDHLLRRYAQIHNLEFPECTPSST